MTPFSFLLSRRSKEHHRHRHRHRRRRRQRQRRRSKRKWNSFLESGMQKTFWGELLKDKERGKSRPLGGGREGREWFKSLVCYLLSSAANESNYRFNLFHSGCKERVILINIKMFSIVLIFQMERKRRNMGWRREKWGRCRKWCLRVHFYSTLIILRR